MTKAERNQPVTLMAITIIAVVAVLGSCTSVKEYQKNKLIWHVAKIGWQAELVEA